MSKYIYFQRHYNHRIVQPKRSVIFSAAAAVFVASSSLLSSTIPATALHAHAAPMMSSSDASGTTATIRPTAWSDDVLNRRRVLEHCIPPLSSSSHKGSSGRVGVLGGSAKYTGAPYYAAMASLKVGADLVTVFTASEAAIPIKCYSPELMVAPVYTAKEFDDIVKQLDNVQDLFDMFSIDNDDGTLNNAKCESDNKVQHLISSMVDEVVANMDKLHVLVIGPGLGRCPLVLEATSRIIQAARRPPYNLSLVLDADALYLLTLPRYQNVLLLPESSSSLSSPAHPPPIVLTPNVMEKKRLDESAVVLPTDGSCIVIEKGRVDEIRQPKYSSENNVDNNSDDDVFELKMSCGEEGGLKRSGGIGDILSGTVGTLLGWNRILTDRNRASGLEDVPLACWTACCFVRRSTKRAFDVHRRGMTAPDILHELAPTINGMTTST